MMKNKIITEKQYLTFDDVLIIPAESSVTPNDVSLKTQLTKNIALSIPVLSAAMDTVTESKMAIKMAQLGGLGIIHKNMSPEDQAKQIFKVKNFESGIINSPINLSDEDTLEEYFENRKKYQFSSFPVVKKGSLDLIGFVSEKDVKFITNLQTPITSIMTKREQLITIEEGTEGKIARDIMQKNKIEQVLIINKQNELVGMVSSLGFVQANLYTQATRDKNNQLMVGAAVGTGDNEKHRVDILISVGVDVLVVDTAHGHSMNVKHMVQYIKKKYPNMEVIAGNIATYDAAKFLIDAGADCLKVGIGAGSICTTRIVAGAGVPQLTALLEVQRACEGTGVYFIADGGIKQSGDIAKSLGTGSCAVMLGSLLAGTDETPGNIISQNGQNFKSYRGMGSVVAMLEGSSDRYFQGHASKNREKLVPEGVESRVVYKGAVETVLYQLLGGLRSSMGYTGSPTLKDFYHRVQYCCITNAGLVESHVHSVQMIGESINYKKG